MRNIDRTAYRDIHNRIMGQGGALESDALHAVAVVPDDPYDAVRLCVAWLAYSDERTPFDAVLSVGSD